MRELKFRAWDAEAQEMVAWEIIILDGFHKYLDGPLMQYTGLKDKNGVEIYEGDLIKLSKPSHSITAKQPALVEFKNEYVGGWVLTHPSTAMHLSLGARDNEEIEVIGNIYENPELLEK